MRNAIVVGVVLLVTGVNAWMTWDLWRDPRSTAPFFPRESVIPGAPTTKRNHTIIRPRRRTAEARPPWSSLESDSYQQYAANLRAIGCPEKTIRDIIVADISKTFNEQRRSINDRTEDSFWLTGDQREELALERQRQVRELTIAKWELLRELFVYPVDEQVLKLVRNEGMAQVGFWMIGGFMEREDLIRFLGFGSYYNEHAEAVVARTQGILLAEDYAWARDLRDEMEKQANALVGSSAVEEMIARVLLGEGDSAGVLNYGVNFSGAELRNLMKIKIAAMDVYDEFFVSHGFKDMRDEKVSEEHVKTAMANYLGRDRYLDFARAQDERYRQIYTFATENGLAKREAVAVFNARDRAETELERLANDASLKAEEQVLLQAAIKTKLEAEIRKHFGENIAREYREDGAGDWIEELIAAPEPAPTK